MNLQIVHAICCGVGVIDKVMMELQYIIILPSEILPVFELKRDIREMTENHFSSVAFKYQIQLHSPELSVFVLKRPQTQYRTTAQAECMDIRRYLQMNELWLRIVCVMCVTV